MSMPTGLNLGEPDSSDDSLAEVKAFFRAIKETSKANIPSDNNGESKSKKTKESAKEPKEDRRAGRSSARSRSLTRKENALVSHETSRSLSMSPRHDRSVMSASTSEESSWDGIQNELMAHPTPDFHRARTVSMRAIPASDSPKSKPIRSQSHSLIGQPADLKTMFAKSSSTPRNLSKLPDPPLFSPIEPASKPDVPASKPKYKEYVQTLSGGETPPRALSPTRSPDTTYHKSSKLPNVDGKLASPDAAVNRKGIVKRESSLDENSMPSNDAPVQVLSCGVPTPQSSPRGKRATSPRSPPFMDYVQPLTASPSSRAEVEPSLSAYLLLNLSDAESRSDGSSSMNATDLLNLLDESSEMDLFGQSDDDDEDSVSISHDPATQMNAKELLAFLEANNKEDQPQESIFPKRNKSDTHVMTLAEMADVLNHVSSRHRDNAEIRFDAIGRIAFRDGEVDPLRPCEFVGDDASSVSSEISLEGMDMTADFWSSGGSFKWNVNDSEH